MYLQTDILSSNMYGQEDLQTGRFTNNRFTDRNTFRQQTQRQAYLQTSRFIDCGTHSKDRQIYRQTERFTEILTD